MALSQFEQEKAELLTKRFVERCRPPEDIRDKVDLGYRIKNQNVEIFEIRPVWNDPGRKIELAIGKATYVKSRKVWRVFWKRADLKWHRYNPAPEVPDLAEFLQIIDEDKYCCFWG